MTASVSERGYTRPDLLADTAWLAANLNDPRLRIVDARGPKEYGAGHLPGAAHLDWTELLDPATRTLKPADDLRRMLTAAGITPNKQVAPYCQGGARGALGALVLRILGYDRAQTYAGSYLQWANQPDTQVEQ